MKKTMKMIGLALMGVLTAGTLASCSQDDEPGGAGQVSSKAIQFNATTNNAAGTRALPTTSANYLTQVKDFKVWGYLAKSNAYYLGNSITDKEIDGGIKIVNKNGKWDYNTATDMVYWPNEAMNFFAFTPTTGTGLDTSGPVVLYNVPDDNSKQQDFMYAFVDGITKNDNNGIVNLQFQHALSQIVFKGMTKSSNLSVEIQSITIHNVYTQVNVNPETKNWYKENITLDRRTRATTMFKNYPVEFDNSKIVSVTDANNAVKLSDDDQALLLPPQELVPWDGKTPISEVETNKTLQNYIEIKCKITSKTNSGTVYLLGSPTVYDSIYFPLSGTWEAGKRYIYTLQFGGGKDKNGNDILAPITFSVQVSDWTDSSSSITM